MMPKEGGRVAVLGIDHQGMRGNLGTGGSLERIGQQRTTQTLPAACLINRQAPHADGWHSRVARELLADASREIGQRHEASRHATPNVLGDLLS